MDKENNVKKMADLLKAGATMLDLYCPACSNILFRKRDGTIFCPVCEKEVKIIKGNKEEDLDFTNNEKENKKKDYSIIDIEIEKTGDTIIDLHNYYVHLLIELTNEIETNKTRRSLKEQLEEVSLLLNIIKKLRELKDV